MRLRELDEHISRAVDDRRFASLARYGPYATRILKRPRIKVDSCALSDPVVVPDIGRGWRDVFAVMDWWDRWR